MNSRRRAEPLLDSSLGGRADDLILFRRCNKISFVFFHVSCKFLILEVPDGGPGSSAELAFESSSVATAVNVNKLALSGPTEASSTFSRPHRHGNTVEY